MYYNFPEKKSVPELNDWPTYVVVSLDAVKDRLKQL
jgi:hypothetical protein